MVLTINNDRIVVIFRLVWAVLHAGDTNEARVESGTIHSSFPAGSAHNLCLFLCVFNDRLHCFFLLCSIYATSYMFHSFISCA